MKTFDGYMHGIGIGGWLTNYRRFKLIPPELRTIVTEGDVQHFDSYITRKDVESIASWGVDHIRLAFDYLVLEDESSPFVYKERGLGYLDNFLEWCKQAGLNVLFDLHKAAGAFCDFGGAAPLLTEPDLQERFIRLWIALAKRYLSEGGNVAFELLNEIVAADFTSWNTLVKRTVDAIREVDPRRAIVVGSARYNAPGAMKHLDVLDDERVVYTFHCYEPMAFTHQKAAHIPLLASFNRYMDYPGPIQPYLDYQEFVHAGAGHLEGLERMDRTFLERCLQPAFDFQKENNVPAYCGEFGVIRHAPMPSRINYYRDVIALCDEHQIGHGAWNYLSTPYDANRFSIVDDWDRKPLSDELIQIIS